MNPGNEPNNDLLFKLMTEMPMIYYGIDTDWNFTLSEGRGLQKLGLKPGEVVGRNAKEMYASVPKIIHAIEEAFTGKSVHTEHQLGDLYLENYIIPTYSEYGKIVGILGATMDITERKRSEIELKELQVFQRALIDSVPGLLYLYNSKGELIFWNKQHETLTGYSDEELDHFQLMDWYPEDTESQQNVIKGLEATAVNGFGDAEANLRIKDGSKVSYYFTACPLVVNGQDCFVGIGINIAKRKEMEKELKELNQNLELQVKERTQELLSANEELSKANEELRKLNQEMALMNDELVKKNEKITKMQNFLIESEKMAALGGLVAGVAHEVNTPIGVGITAATHMIDVIEEVNRGLENKKINVENVGSYFDEMKEAAHIIDKNLGRAGKLIQSFKKLSVDQSSEPRRVFKVGQYLDEIIISLSPTLKKSQVTMEVACDDTISIDGYPGAFSQVITNLVMNSLSHGFEERDKGKIKIDIEAVEGGLQLTYSDDGKGMEDDVLQKIFDPFFTTKRAKGGTGLGLSMVYSIITQQFSGTIACSSNPDSGTVFEIFLSEKGADR